MNKKGTTRLRNEQEMAQDSTMNESMRKQGTKMDYQRRQESFKVKKKGIQVAMLQDEQAKGTTMLPCR